MKLLKNGLSMTRRQFGLAAIAAAGLMSGCSTGDDGELLYFPTPQQPEIIPPVVDEKGYPGAASWACGSCFVRAYVKNGVIKRMEADERPDTEDIPQVRCCVRCRSIPGRVHSPARLLYPLIYDPENTTTKRGDLTKFKRATWAEAAKYIYDKYNDIHSRFPNSLGVRHTGYGMMDTNHNGNPLNWAFNQMGGWINSGWGAPSSHASDRIMPHIAGGGFRSFGIGYSAPNLRYSNTIILWGSHFASSTDTPGFTWEFVRAKEKGAKIIYIGPVLNYTAQFADEYVAVKPAADLALMLALIYVMLDEELVDVAALDRYVFGFFHEDGSKPRLGTSSFATPDTTTPMGQCFASYIMGNAANKCGKSIPASTYGSAYYPNRASSKYSFKKTIDSPKSPEWAAPICGISAAKIRELARLMADRTKKVAFRTSLGLQRQPLGYANYWALCMLVLATGQFGKTGTGLNIQSNSGGIATSPYGLGASAWPSARAGHSAHSMTTATPSTANNPATTGLITSSQRSYCEMIWHDFLRRSNRGTTSRWKDGEINNNPPGNAKNANHPDNLAGGRPVKFIYTIGVNSLVQQHQDPFEAIDLLEDRSEVELIINYDNFLSPSARYADVILPGDTYWERPDFTTSLNFTVYRAGPVKTIGDMKSSPQAAAELVKPWPALSDVTEAMITGGLTAEERAEARFKSGAIANQISWEEFKEIGILTSSPLTAAVQRSSTAAGTDSREASFAGINSYTGYYEAYCMNVVNNYENRQNLNKDDEGEPEVLPIPHWVPFDDDMLMHYEENGITNKLDDYPFMNMGQKSMWSIHSNHAMVSLLRELYRRDEDGTPSHDNQSFSKQDWDNPSKQVFDENNYKGGYAPIFMNPEDAAAKGLRDGDLVKVTSALNMKSLIASLNVTGRCPSGTTYLEEGPWFDPVVWSDGELVDRGGCNGTIVSEKPARFDRGNNLTWARVKVVKTSSKV